MVSFAELFLLIWALGATGIALHFRNEEKKAKMAVIAILDDERVRNELVEKHKQFKRMFGIKEEYKGD